MEHKKSHYHLYVLRLESDKYYVGITTKTPEIRMQEHIRGVRVAYWTAKYKPKEIIFSKDLGLVSKKFAEKQENRLTRDLMRQRGINNVRGGDLTDTKDYVKRFGYIFVKDEWQLVVYLIVLLSIILYFVIDKYVIRKY